jgi:flagellar assembly factor FliW
MKMENQFIGKVEIKEEEIIYFPNGIIGFEKFKRFIVVQDKKFSPFYWLLTIEDQDFGIPLINPYSMMKDFNQEFPAELTEELKDSNSQYEVFCVVNLKGTEGLPTVNLKGPILIDYANKIGKQVILNAELLPISYPLN